MDIDILTPFPEIQRIELAAIPHKTECFIDEEYPHGRFPWLLDVGDRPAGTVIIQEVPTHIYVDYRGLAQSVVGGNRDAIELSRRLIKRKYTFSLPQIEALANKKVRRVLYVDDDKKEVSRNESLLDFFSLYYFFVADRDHTCRVVKLWHSKYVSFTWLDIACFGTINQYGGKYLVLFREK